MDEIVHKLQNEISELQQEVKDLSSALTSERVSNMNFDLTQKEQKQKIDDLKDQLAKEKLKNNTLNQQLQELQIESEQQIQEFNSVIIQQHQQLQSLQIQLQQQQNYINQLKMNDDDDEFAKFDHLNLGDDDDDDDDPVNDDDEQNEDKELRQRLLETQMEHEDLKRKHRKSIAKLEEYELDALQKHNNASSTTQQNEDLSREDPSIKIEQLQKQVEDEKKKRENLDKERRNSLAQLSQNMFKKLLDAEHQHYDQTSNLEQQCHDLTSQVKQLKKSKENLLIQSNKAIDELRQHIKFLSERLQKYENWD